MGANEFQFFLSCDINLPLTFKIECLEGKLPSLKPPDSANSSCTVEERKPELYVECMLYVDGAPFGLPMRTRLETSGPSFSWNELITLSTKYRDLTVNSQLGITVYDVSCNENEEVVGGATVRLFNLKKQLKTGKHKLRLWSGKDANGSLNTTTPGKVPKEERGELERLEKLVNKYERGQIQRVDWLDRLAFKSMEKIKDRENSKNGSSHLYVVIEFCSFEHRVVFQVMTDQASYIKSLEKKVEKLKRQNLCLALDKDELQRKEEHLRGDVDRFAYYLHDAEEKNRKAQEELELSLETVAEMIELRDNLLEKIQSLRDQIDEFMHQHALYRGQTDAQIQELHNTVEVLSDQNAVLHGHIEHLETVIANHEEEDPEEDPEAAEAEVDPMDLGLGEIVG